MNAEEPNAPLHPLACAGCLAFAPTQADLQVGECRRKSPVIVQPRGNLPAAVWPAVTAFDWCLENVRQPVASSLVQKPRKEI